MSTANTERAKTHCNVATIGRVEHGRTMTAAMPKGLSPTDGGILVVDGSERFAIRESGCCVGAAVAARSSESRPAAREARRNEGV
ncbi:MAG TPA: hypothetical protein VES39_00965 [Rhodospirillales bacterium]|nr:hypothetical protein [Rhodospirillales bacterium]